MEPGEVIPLRSAAGVTSKEGVVRTAKKAIRKLGSVKTVLERLDSKLKLQRYRIRDYKPNVSFEFQRGKFTIKTAANGKELEECLRLRFDVFHREYQNKRRTEGVDIDKLDFVCDHLVIIEKTSGRVIGTYRMNSSLFSDTFYAATEFNIDKLLEIPGNKLELGRACIDREYRTGAVISLLWRGIFRYAALTETSIFFGCTSVKATDPLEIGMVTKFVSENAPIADEASVMPLKKFRVPHLRKALQYIESNPFEYRAEVVSEQIPALFSSYLSLGAKVFPEPALDRDFGCIDFLTIVYYDQIEPGLKAKFEGEKVRE